MSLARVKVWNPGDVLTANDLNAEFNNILNNPGTLISPISANLDFGNFQAVRFRAENVTTTQAATQVGRLMFNTSADTLDVDDGSFMRHTPGIKSSQVSSTGSVPVPDGMIAKAWVAFNGVAASSQLTAITAFNVSTALNALVRQSAGTYEIDWLNPFSSRYAAVATVNGSTATAFASITSITSSGVILVSFGSTAAGAIDANYVSVVAFGVQV